MWSWELARRAARSGFAFDEGEVAEVVAVEVEEIEDEVGEGLFGSFLKGGLEVGEAGVAFVVEDDDFAVEDGGFAGEDGDLGGDGLHAVGPVEAGAGEELDLRAGFAGLNAVAVEF